jgi:heat shock protein HslJ
MPFLHSDSREFNMRIARLVAARILLMSLFVASHLFLSGCNDPSRTSGTMVQESEEDKAYRKSKMEKLKGRPKVQDKQASKSVRGSD